MTFELCCTRTQTALFDNDETCELWKQTRPLLGGVVERWIINWKVSHRLHIFLDGLCVPYFPCLSKVPCRSPNVVCVFCEPWIHKYCLSNVSRKYVMHDPICVKSLNLISVSQELQISHKWISEKCKRASLIHVRLASDKTRWSGISKWLPHTWWSSSLMSRHSSQLHLQLGWVLACSNHNQVQPVPRIP